MPINLPLRSASLILAAVAAMPVSAGNDDHHQKLMNQLQQLKENPVVSKKLKTLSMILGALAAAHANAANEPHKLVKDLFKEKSMVTSIAEAARSAKKLAGSAAAHGVLTSDDEQYFSILKREFDYITPENAGKWGVLQAGGPDNWDFLAHDELVDFAGANRKLFKGHTLVWHSQLPEFINDSLSAAELQDYIEAHMTTTMERYRGDIYAWDVVNEAIDEDGSYRDSVFLRKLGTDYIADAFRLANSLDRKAKLLYNDFNIEGINPKSDAVYEMVKQLKNSGVPIDGVGFQMHLTANAPSTEEMIANFERFAELGLSINISELDVRVADLPWDHATKMAIQRQVYHRVVHACLQVKACDAVTTWGFTDLHSWVDSTFGADDPLPFDAQYQKKPAYYGMVDGFMGIVPDAMGARPNLVANSHFEAGTDGWSSTAKLSRAAKRKHVADGESAMVVSKRTDASMGAKVDLTAMVAAGRTYHAGAEVSLSNARPDSVFLQAQYRCSGEMDESFTVDGITSRRNQWSELQAEIEVPDCELEYFGLHIDGPAAGVELLVDNVSLRPDALIPDSTGLGPNIVVNPDFEEDAFGWYGFGSPTIEASSAYAANGYQSGFVSGRTDTWQGPATSLFLDAQPGTDYQLLSWVRMADASAQVNATVVARCAAGDQYIQIGSTTAGSDGFAVLAGSFTVPDCNLSDLVLYFEGPAAGADFYLDDVYVRQVLSSAVPNLLTNGDFESGVGGWQAWGGAVISASSMQANSGTQSALVTNRSANWQGPVVNILPTVAAGGHYSVSAFGRVAGVAADQLNITLKTVCASGGEQYHQLDSATVTNSGWTELSGEVDLPSCQLTEATLYFDGPAAGVDVYLDDVVLLGEAPAGEQNIVDNGDFESGLTGWSAWGGSLNLSSAVVHGGSYSVEHSSRSGNWQGPVYNLQPAVTGGGSYDFSAFGRIAGASSASMSITVKTVCEGGAEQYQQAGSQVVNDASWTELTGTLTLPACNFTEVSMYFDGPAVGITTYLDDVVVTARD